MGARLWHRPDILHAGATTNVRHVELHLRRYVRGEPGNHIEHAIEGLLLLAVAGRGAGAEPV